MEEAEALCDRVGIISKGELKCIGSTPELKELYGEGYRLHLSFQNILNPGNKTITEELQKQFNAKILNELDTRVILKVEK